MAAVPPPTREAPGDQADYVGRHLGDESWVCCEGMNLQELETLRWRCCRRVQLHAILCSWVSGCDAISVWYMDSAEVEGSGRELRRGAVSETVEAVAVTNIPSCVCA